jgi:SnoaL-like domain
MTDTPTQTASDSTTADAPDYTPAIDAYFAMLNETDADARLAHARRAWADDGTYVDPLLQAAGHDGLSDMIAGVHAQFPGQRFARTTGIDSHHDLVRFGWELAADDGTVTVAGLDVAVMADDGRLHRLAGFFGPLPEREDG